MDTHTYSYKNRMAQTQTYLHDVSVCYVHRDSKPVHRTAFNMLAWTYGDKKPRTEARGHLLPNLVPMFEQNNYVKGYFFRAGQCAALSSFRV